MSPIAVDVPAWRMAPTLEVSTARLLLVDVPARQADALREYVGDVLVELTTIDAVSCDVGTFARMRPHVVLVPIWRLSLVTPHAMAAGVPVIALNLRAQAVDWTMSALRDVAAVTSVDIASDPRATLETSLRVASRTRLDGGVAIVLPGPAGIIEEAHAVARIFGLRVVACRSEDTLPALVSELSPALLFAGAWASDAGIARAVDVQSAASTALAVASIGAEALAGGLTVHATFPRATDPPEQALGELATALDAVRRSRVMAGRHAATNLALPRTLVAQAQAVFVDTGAAHPRGVIVFRATGEPRADSHALWVAECLRLSAGARAHFPQVTIGHDEDDSLIMLVSASAADVESFAQSMVQAQRGLAWAAGIADAAETKARDFSFLRSCAREALASDDVGTIRRWQRDTARSSPDVIIVEPDALLSQMLQYGLRSIGHSCRAIETGTDALDMLRRMPPTARPVLIVTDVDLAGIDGHSLHERLRVERPGAFEFVFLTNHAAEGEQLRALEAGAREYLIKPISVRVLLARLARLLSSN